MSSVLTPCAFCGLGIRSAGNQPTQGPNVCENEACQAELARSVRVNNPAPEAKKAKK